MLFRCPCTADAKLLCIQIVNHIKILYGININRTKQMVSTHLQAEQQRLLDAITQIWGTGAIAPAYCWLTVSTVTRGGKTYEYARLVTEKPESKPKIRSLGRQGSERHRHWRTAIARREAIAELEQQLKSLQALVERQAAAQSKLDSLLEASPER